MTECKAIIEANELIDALRRENEQLNKHCVEYGFIVGNLKEKNKVLEQDNKDAWNLIRFIYNEIKEDGSMDWWRIQDLVEFEE